MNIFKSILKKRERDPTENMVTKVIILNVG